MGVQDLFTEVKNLNPFPRCDVSKLGPTRAFSGFSVGKWPKNNFLERGCDPNLFQGGLNGPQIGFGESYYEYLGALSRDFENFDFSSILSHFKV